MAKSFTFELVSPEKLLLSVEAEAVGVPGADGDFTVMANKAPTMANVQAGFMDITKADGSSESFYVGGGLIECGTNTVTMLAEFASSKDDLNAEFFAAQKQLAEEKLEGAKETGDEGKITAAATVVSRIEHLASVS